MGNQILVCGSVIVRGLGSGGDTKVTLRGEYEVYLVLVISTTHNLGCEMKGLEMGIKPI